MKRIFVRKSDNQDFSKYLGEIPQTRKQRLLDECNKNDVSIHTDDPAEQSAGIYAELRAVASEAELERRLNSKKAVGMADRANRIAVVALIASLAALAKSFLDP